MTKKDEKILKDAETQNIPVFVFTAKDMLSISVLIGYRDMCKEFCDQEHVDAINARIMEFLNWQEKNVDFVKFPD